MCSLLTATVAQAATKSATTQPGTGTVTISFGHVPTRAACLAEINGVVTTEWDAHHDGTTLAKLLKVVDAHAPCSGEPRIESVNTGSPGIYNGTGHYATAAEQICIWWPIPFCQPNDLQTEEFQACYWYNGLQVGSCAGSNPDNCVSTFDAIFWSDTQNFCAQFGPNGSPDHPTLVRDEWTDTFAYPPAGFTIHYWYWMNLFVSGYQQFGCREC
jgi:hypothetical protein